MRVTLTIPDEVWDALKAQAERERRTTSNLAVLILVEAVLDGIPSVRHAVEQVRAGETLTKDEVFPSPPLDTQGVALKVQKGKATLVAGGSAVVRELTEEEAKKSLASLCTCTPPERVKGKHNKWCPAKGV